MKDIEPILGRWNRYFVRKDRTIKPHVMGDPHTAKLAAQWLDRSDVTTIEDWGSGHGGFREFVSDRQICTNVDGSESPHTDKVVDLRFYQSEVDAIHLRHVLEHNHNWHLVVDSLVKSFKVCAVITLFTPLVEQTHIIKSYKTGFVDYAFREEDITSRFSSDITFTIEREISRKKTQYSNETMFFLERGL